MATGLSSTIKKAYKCKLLNKVCILRNGVNFFFADGLHFFLSLGVDIKTSKKSYNRTKHCDNLTSQFHEIYHRIDVFKKKQDDTSYIKAFQSFLNLLPLLGYRWSSLEEAYYKKLGVNYNRQETNY